MTRLLIDSWLLLTGSFLVGSAAAYLLAVMMLPVAAEAAAPPEPVAGRPGSPGVPAPAREGPPARTEATS